MSHFVRTMIDMSFACLIFVMAAPAGLLLFQSGAAALDTAYVSGKAQDRNVMPTPITGDGSVSGAEVLQTIAQIGEIGMEVVVDGTRYAPSLEREDIAVSAIRLNGRYAPSYERGPDGQLKQIVFVSR
ncbi:hypothetical protein [Cohnella algarum]|uniref:hypothetical protein n=1 Tax=Cohnella algarum TaxID=2044859 RepID=UPI001968600F|nr:hypothetical protein [Cohnella algarum]MBN2981833.1 hypothetical protein [Cohnella algarum]